MVIVLVGMVAYFFVFRHKSVKHLKKGTIIKKTKKQVVLKTFGLKINNENFKKIKNFLKIPQNITSNDIVKFSKNNTIINPVLTNYLMNHISLIRSNGLVVVDGGLIHPTYSMFDAYVHIENGNMNILITEDFLDYLFVYAQTEIFYYLVNNYLYRWLYELLISDLEVLEQLYQNGNKYALLPMIYDSVALKILNNSFNPPNQIKDFVKKYILLIEKVRGYYLLPLNYDKYCFSGFDLIESKYGLKIDKVKNLSQATICEENLPCIDYGYYKDYLNKTKYGRFLLALVWLSNSRFSLTDENHVKIALTWLYSLEICNNRFGNCFDLWYRIHKVLTTIFMRQDLLNLYDLYLIVKNKLNNELDINKWFRNWQEFKSNKEFSLFSINTPYPLNSIYKTLTYPKLNGDKNILLEYYNGKLNLSNVLEDVRILPNEMDVVSCLDNWVVNKYYTMYNLNNYQGYLNSLINLRKNISNTLFVKIMNSNLKSMPYYPGFMNKNYARYKRIISTLGLIAMIDSLIFRTKFEKPSSFIVLRNNVSMLVLPYFDIMYIYYKYFEELYNYLEKLGIKDEKLEFYLLNIAKIFERFLEVSEEEFYQGKIVRTINLLKIYKDLTNLTSIALGPLLFKSLEYYGYKAYYYGAINGINYEIMILRIGNGYMVFIGPVFNYNEFYSRKIITENYWENYVSQNIERPKIYSLIDLSCANKNYLIV